jgi:hypothetical protein
MLAAAGQAGAAQIILHDIGGVDPGSNAARGFRAAANFWASRITNDATIQLDVGFQPLAEDILGQTGSTVGVTTTQNVYLGLALNAQSALDVTAVTHLQPLHASDTPGVGAISMVTPGYTGVSPDGVGFGVDTAHPIFDDGGDANNTTLGVNTANLKAMGFNVPSSTIDGSITFNSTIPFDFNPTNGIGDGQADFIGTAIHEIGHALGFVSAVDDYDVIGLPDGPAAHENCGTDAQPLDCSDVPVNETWWGYTGDLFRYDKPGELDWNPGDPNYFSVDGGLTSLGAFSTGAFNGDGWQASHWKAPDDPPCSGFIGIMNPYLCGGVAGFVTGVDFAYFDAIGYNFDFKFDADTAPLFTSADAFRAIPEPTTWTLAIIGLALTGGLLRRRRVSAAT